MLAALMSLTVSFFVLASFVYSCCCLVVSLGPISFGVLGGCVHLEPPAFVEGVYCRPAVKPTTFVCLYEAALDWIMHGERQGSHL